MPIFGYPYTGTTELAIKNRIAGSWFRCPQRCIAQSISAFFYPGIAKAKCAIYRRSDNRLIGVTEEKTNLPSGFSTFNFPDPKPSLADIDYWLVTWGGDVGNLNITPQTAKGGYQEKTYNSFPDPWYPLSINYVASIYCTYQPLILKIRRGRAISRRRL